MAKVRIKWEETTSYDQVFEIPDFNPGNDYHFAEKLVDAIVERADFSMVDEVSDREITDWNIEKEVDD